MSQIKVNGLTIDGIEGTREELAELAGLLEEVVDRAYKGNKKHLLADLASVLEQNTCKCEKTTICREVIEEVEKWANKKLDSIQRATDFIRAVEMGDEDSSVGADDWSSQSDCDKNTRQLMMEAHSTPVH